MVPRKLVNPEDLDLVRLSTSLDESVSIIEAHKVKFDAAREMLILEARPRRPRREGPAARRRDRARQLPGDDLAVVEREGKLAISCGENQRASAASSPPFAFSGKPPAS